MNTNLLDKISKKQVALGAWVNSTDPIIAEIFTTFGCDWVFIDTEHEAIGRRDLLNLLLAFKGTSCTSIVRVPANTAENVKWVLDAGAGGIVIPQIHTADDVKAAVQHARYFPMGSRGMGALRASQFGKDSEYYTRANRETVLMIEIEHIEAAQNIDAILQVQGFDAIFIGFLDLAQSMGRLNNPEHPDVQNKIADIIARSIKAGKPAGITARNTDELSIRLKQGATLIILGSDYGFIRESIKSRIEQARKVMEENR
jgi:2-keto-3-deoxy-L-rhamnonate aldolase RhmA